MSTLVGSNEVVEDIVKDKFAEIFITLRDHADECGVPVFNKEEWKNIVDNYDRKKVIEVLAHYIVNNKPTFPLRKISHDKMKKCFKNLLDRDMSDLKIVRWGMTMIDYIVKLKYDYDGPTNWKRYKGYRNFKTKCVFKFGLYTNANIIESKKELRENMTVFVDNMAYAKTEEKLEELLKKDE